MKYEEILKFSKEIFYLPNTLSGHWEEKKILYGKRRKKKNMLILQK